MLEVVNQDYLDKTKAFAKERGLTSQLEEQLTYLAGFGGDPQKVVCSLQPDRPRSFYFNMYRCSDGGERQFWFNGGLVYQAPDMPADGSAPSFTVSLAEGTGWFVHT